jgi:phosphoribosylanthranilate isomerase
MGNINQTNSFLNTMQIKICGLTRVDEALGCVELGADAIGLVFYSKSPRYITMQKAKEICLAVPEKIKTVGVFVDETFSNIMHIAGYCRLKGVQLHGNECPGLVERLAKEKLIVIKALFSGRKPHIDDACNYGASAFLVECGKGVLPGGNAEVWDWKEAQRLGNNFPLILAGGLSYENVAAAVNASLPDAVDVSSGVESSPGRKDLNKVASFIKKVSGCSTQQAVKKVF